MMLSRNVLAMHLHEAKEAHTRFEAAFGQDPHWEPWYAAYILNRMSGASEAEAYTLTVTANLASPGVK